MRTRETQVIGVAFFVSLALHLIFFGSSRYLWVEGVSGMVETTRKMFNIESVESEARQQTSREIVESYVEKLKFKNPAADIKEVSQALKKHFDEIQKPQAPGFTDIQPEAMNSELLPPPAEDLNAQKREIEIKKRKVVQKESLEEVDVLKAWKDFEEALGGDIDVPAEFVEAMIGFTPAAQPSAGYARRTFGGETASREGTAMGQGRFEAIDRFLDVEVRTYRDPADGQGYFQLAIIPGTDAGALEVLPKEVVFLVDASLSINRLRLREFKKGIAYSLENLNPEDRFNIFTFKEEINSFSEKSLKASKANIEEALDFVSKLHASQRTDLYRGFIDTFRTRAVLEPSYLMLFSDGRPNTGVISPIKIISEISQLNERKRAIFALSGGKRVNRFLLDFMAYQNRGWSEYAEDDKGIPGKIQSIYDKIRNPILLNLRFQLNQLDERQVYPKHLPDFFRDTAFVIYGTFRDEKEFSMRVLGEVAGGETREFIFSRDLSEAGDGGPEIARRWALNKMYHLVSRLTLQGYDPEAMAELAELSRKFKIRTPYRF